MTNASSLPVHKYNVKEMFGRYDVDGNGQVSINDLARLFSSLGENPSADSLAQIIRDLDTDGTGTVSYDEFCAYFQNIPTIPKNITENAIEEFRAMDVTGSGKVTKKEFMRATGWPEEWADDWIRSLDTDEDGLVSYAEVLKMYEY